MCCVLYREILRLLECGINPNTCLEDGTPLLHLVVGGESRSLQTEAAEILLSYGTSVNVQAEDGCSALHVAASWGRLDLIHLLVCNGADIEIRDEDGCSAADLAAEHQHAQCEEWLRACCTALVMDDSVFYVSKLGNEGTDEDENWDDGSTILVEMSDLESEGETTIEEGETTIIEGEEDGGSYSEAPSQILRMTDRELRGALKLHGVDAGPLTPSTRPLYVRYLHRLEDEGPHCYSHQMPYSNNGNIGQV